MITGNFPEREEIAQLTARMLLEINAMLHHDLNPVSLSLFELVIQLYEYFYVENLECQP